MSGKSIPVSDQYPEQEIITDSAVEGEAQGKAHASPSTSHTIELRNPGSVRGGWDLLQSAMPARSVVADQGSSTVRSSAPFAWTASRRQERTAFPFSSTVQAPQTPC